MSLGCPAGHRRGWGARTSWGGDLQEQQRPCLRTPSSMVRQKLQ